jgi:hypothetical protein
MYQGYRIVAVTPAGRRRYLRILLPYILNQSHVIDEYQLWLNCYDDVSGAENRADFEFCQRAHNRYPNFVKLMGPKPRVLSRSGHFSRNRTIHQFFENCVDPGSIYLRFDDDIVYVAPDAVGELVQYRISNPKYFLVFANIINNAILSHIHQRSAAISCKRGVAGYACMCPVGWRDPDFAEHVHRSFLDALNEQHSSRFRFREWVLCGPAGPERCSINCFAFFGAKFAEFEGKVGPDEERWLTLRYPRETNSLNAICGTAIVSHFAFQPQRGHLDRTDILSQYAKLARIDGT